MQNRTINNKAAVRFVLLLLSIYCCLYSTNYMLTGLMQPAGYYSHWLAKHFDYVTAFRTFLLSSTGYIAELFGHDTYLKGNILYVKGGQNIRIVYSCMGINILCLWWAFILAIPVRLSNKMFHFIIGTLCLIALNIARLSLLTLSPNSYSSGNLIIDHHTLYNCVVYGVILIVIKRIVDKKITT